MELHNTLQHKSFLWHLDFEPRDNDDFTAMLRLLERWLRTLMPNCSQRLSNIAFCCESIIIISAKADAGEFSDVGF